MTLTQQVNAAALLLGLPLTSDHGVWLTPGKKIRYFASRPEFYRRVALPYGIWVCEGGRSVLFNRFYEPIWQNVGGVITRADPSEWVKGITAQYYCYVDGVRDRAVLTDALETLRQFRRGEPSWFIHTVKVVPATSSSTAC